MANVLPLDKQVMAISALTEGCAIRAVERLTGVHRDTIMRLGVRIGEGCARLHDTMMQNLQAQRPRSRLCWCLTNCTYPRGVSESCGSARPGPPGSPTFATSVKFQMCTSE